MILLVFSCNTGQRQQIGQAGLTASIRLNQVGYYPELQKQFTVNDTTAQAFSLVTEQGKIVFRGELVPRGYWKPSEETLVTGDFSAFQKKGTYFIHVPGVGKSHTFIISDTIYQSAARDALKTFYFMRTGVPIEAEYVGKFSRLGGHPDDTVYFHPSSGYDEGWTSSPGGWYDAGDYGKYVVNASIATGTMLNLYELFPEAFPDGSLNIPESGNGISDLLDEMRFEFEWILTMQDKDGGVFHKLTPLRHDGITMPHETYSDRYMIGKSTAATLDFAAMLAQASRIYAESDAGFAQECLEAARRAYSWAHDHPSEYFSNPEGINTGGYGDRVLDEEFFWAAAELYVTTGEEIFYQEIRPKLGDVQFRLEESWRNYVDNLGYYSLYMSERLGDADRQVLEEGITALANRLIIAQAGNPYGIPIERFVWGSNSDILNTAMVQVFAYDITGEKQYLEAAAGITDYIFGRNATGYSFVSGYGDKSSANFHHRLLMADDLEATFPGFVAGGPNMYMQDREGLRQQGADYPSTIPAKAYIDHDGSYASNEICINWNAPLVFVLGALEQYTN